MSQDWEYLANVMRQDMPQQSYKRGTAQECKLPGACMTAMFQNCENLSFVLRQSVHQQCFMIVSRSAL